MFTMTCDQCKKNADPIKEKPLKLPHLWWAIFYDGEEYHFCSAKCVGEFLAKKFRDNDEP